MDINDNNTLKKPWYLQSLFLCILFALWPLVVPLVIGIILLQESIKHDKETVETVSNLKISVKSQIEKTEADYKCKLDDVDSEINKQQSKLADCKDKQQTLNSEIKQLEAEIANLNKKFTLGLVSIEAYENLKSDEVKNELQLLRMRQDEMVKDGLALQIKRENYRDKKELTSQVRQIIRCFNSETISIIESASIKNIDNCRQKLQKSFENINKIFDIDGVSISENYLRTKLEELSIIYAYIVKADEEKETAKAIREQLQEEEKVRREIEREKAKIEKEETQFKNEVSKLMSYLQKTSLDVEKQLYLDKIRELEEKLQLLEKDKENVFEREQNTRAGFVYIISNIGSFGENVYKIGMTRRLEPMDRVKELGDASVPFGFDVHAMIFSEDAPTLENILHKTFQEAQLNKVNCRKEFFKVDLDDIKRIVKENYNATVQFVDIADATEYRESLRRTEMQTV